jgi:hypothetical protein
MKMVSKKGALLIGAALVACVLAIPSMSSASSWGTIGTSHTLDSPNLGFISHAPPVVGGQFSWLCFESQLQVDVASAAALRITGATFKNCTSSGPGTSDCTITATATRLPWTVTGTATNNIQIHDLFVDLRFETKPGGASGSCFFHNQDMTWTGTMSGGFWTAEQHEIHLTNASGTALDFQFGGLPFTAPTTMRGGFRDTGQSLTLT